MRRSARLLLCCLAAVLGRGVVMLASMLALLAPSAAWAGTPYALHWVHTEDASSCEQPFLEEEGLPMFSVNQTSLPTYTVPGAYEESPDGSQRNRMEAKFDSVLLYMGANDFGFSATTTSGDNSCVQAHEVVNLVSEPLGLNKPLFDVRRDRTAFFGSTRIELSLAEINPPLARDIEALKAAIADEQRVLVNNASRVADLAWRLDQLRQLDTELTDLVRRPLDEIARTDLQAILDRYTRVVDARTREALEQLVDDLKASVTELENELARIIDEFGAQADAVADLATQSARDAGWNPDDPMNYALGEGAVPWVEVPDIAEVEGAFDPGRDPYAAYADAVIAALEADVDAGRVAARADFVANVRAWRANDAALERALLSRVGVSRAETNAFLNAQIRITAYVRRFMDSADWFVETPVPADLRLYVDSILMPRFRALADHMKDNLNLWQGDALDLEQTELYQTINAFAGAMSTLGDGAEAYAGVMQVLVHATSRFAVGFVPFVGPALDFCECITGKAWCLPSGHELSDEERIFSGIGFAAGAIGPVFRGVGTSSGLRPSAVRVAGEVAEIDQAVARALKANRRTWYKTLRGAVTSVPMNEFEKKAAKFLMDDGRALLGVGDDGVRRMLGIPMRSPVGGLSKAPDFVTVTRGGGLALSEAKGGIIRVGEVRDQLSNAMRALERKGLAGDVERVELIVQQGARFEDAGFAIKDGYLFDLNEGRPVTLDGFNKFIMVIRL